MNDEWILIIAECERLSKKTGVKAPDFDRVTSSKGRIQADVWLKEKTLLNHLSGFLSEVNEALADESGKSKLVRRQS